MTIPGTIRERGADLAAFVDRVLNVAPEPSLLQPGNELTAELGGTSGLRV